MLQFFMEGFSPSNICHDVDPGHSVVTSPLGRQDTDRWLEHFDRCTSALSLAAIVGIVLLMALTAAQGTLALAMRRHGKEFGREAPVPNSVVVVTRDVKC